jgi:putative molybdopterin biosynthesis protein
VSRALVEALSLGFPPEEVEAKVVLHLARFRREAARGPRKKAASVRRRPGLVVSGSHDLALDLLASHMRGLAGLEMTASNTGSLGGLIDLARDKAHVAGCHLLDKESGEYNIPFVKRILAGVPSLVVTLVERTQGFLVAKGNPKNLRAPEDLARDDVTFINRQKGSGTRVLLDFLSRRSGVIPQQVGGYDVEVDTHIEVAEAIASGRADVGLGILAAARATGLDFIPLRNERYDLVVPKSSLDRPQVRALRKTLESREYRASVQSLGGYDTSLTGVVLAEIGA